MPHPEPDRPPRARRLRSAARALICASVLAIFAPVRAAAQDAGRLLFGTLPVDFPLTVAIVDNYGEAK